LGAAQGLADERHFNGTYIHRETGSLDRARTTSTLRPSVRLFQRRDTDPQLVGGRNFRAQSTGDSPRRATSYRCVSVKGTVCSRQASFGARVNQRTPTSSSLTCTPCPPFISLPPPSEPSSESFWRSLCLLPRAGFTLYVLCSDQRWRTRFASYRRVWCWSSPADLAWPVF
jgi:hypothetical protein